MNSYTIQNIYFGYEFEKILASCPSSKEKKEELKERCLRFLQVLLQQLQQRLPKNVNILQTVSLVLVKNVLQVIKEPLTPLAQMLGINALTIDKINIQWTNLINVKWTEKSNTVHFWNEVASYTDASGTHTFAEVSNLAIRLLVLPWSNAEVERLFRQMNVVKNKFRNRMGSKLLDAILTTKAGLKRNSVCCSKYNLPVNILKQIGSTTIYTTENQIDENDMIIDNDLFV